jgi:hypothetical protein
MVALAAALAGTWASAAVQQAPSRRGEDQQKPRFVQLLRDEEHSPVALQTAVVHCVPLDCGRQGPTVDLVAAIHVAERSYYRQLNKQFEDYDCVLYELVASEKTAIAQGRSGTSAVSLLQQAIQDVLQLEFQLEAIDYTRKNMVHADMTRQQFAQSMRDRGETYWSIVLRMMGYALAAQNRQTSTTSDSQLLLALFSKDRPVVLKRLLAEQFEDLEGSISALDGPRGSTLISQRNKVVLEVLRKEIAAGRRKIAIFYGAGHMPGLLQRLCDDFALTPISTRWLVAWDLKSDENARAKGAAKTVGGRR